MSELALSAGLTARTSQLCIGLEYGVADIYELITPTTAELLKWWFGEDMIATRSTLNFHAVQRQAILNTIVAHEVFGAGSLLDNPNPVGKSTTFAVQISARLELKSKTV